MLDTFLLLLLAALAVQIAMTQVFLSSLRVGAPQVFERLGRPNACFFLVHGGPGDRHPFLEFLRRKNFVELPPDSPALRISAGRLRLLYRVVGALWIAAIASAVLQVATYLSR